MKPVITQFTRLLGTASVAAVILMLTSCGEKDAQSHTTPKNDDAYELEHRNISGSSTNSEGAGGENQ